MSEQDAAERERRIRRFWSGVLPASWMMLAVCLAGETVELWASGKYSQVYLILTTALVGWNLRGVTR